MSPPIKIPYKRPYRSRQVGGQKMAMVMVNLQDLLIPIRLAKSIVRNKPNDVKAQLLMIPTTREPILIVNQKQYRKIDQSDRRFMRDSTTIDKYLTRGLSDESFIQLLAINPIIIKEKGSFYEIIDGLHRIERAIWLNMTQIPAYLKDREPQ